MRDNSVSQSSIEGFSDKFCSHELPEVSRSLARFPEEDSSVMRSLRLPEVSKELLRSPEADSYVSISQKLKEASKALVGSPDAGSSVSKSHRFPEAGNALVRSEKVDLYESLFKELPEVSRMSKNSAYDRNYAMCCDDGSVMGFGYEAFDSHFTLDAVSPEAETDVNFDSYNGLRTKESLEMSGCWANFEKEKSSTWRELEAVRRVLFSTVNELAKKSVQLFTDNKNLTYILYSGSNIDELHEKCLSIRDVLDQNDISFDVQWIPRSRNEKADYLSRCFDVDDWCVNDDVFSHLETVWGHHSVDRFASHFNNKCMRFNSKWWVPGTEAVDCLKQQWADEANWIVPPPKLAVECVHKLVSEGCTGTLVVPKWPSAPFWPLIVNKDGQYKSFVVDSYMFSVKDGIMPGRGNNGIFTDVNSTFDMLALRLDCRKN